MKLHNTFLLIFFLCFLFSCEEVIVLDLKETPPQTVVEANLDAGEGTCQVLISKSNGFYDTKSFEKVGNASIELFDNSGSNYTFSKINDGEYLSDNINVISGEEFTIKITIDNIIYQASALAPFPVVLDSLEPIESSGGMRGGNNSETQYDIFLNWTDLANEVDFYRAKLTTNGEYQADDYFLYDDKNQDGNDIRASLIRKTFEEGDTVQIELVSINKAVYKYFSDLSAIQSNGLNATTPFNPKSNFDNNALGYFGIWYSDVKEIEVK